MANLTASERQAYEGARMFYMGVLPASILYICGALLYLLEVGLNQSVWEVVVLIGLMWLTYAVALKQYLKCNQIDVQPAQQIVEAVSRSQMMETDTPLAEELSLHADSPNAKPSKFYCSTCHSMRDYRTRHCRKCQVCVERYDHHCFWIGNCVGRHNHRRFYLFLFTQTLNSTATLLSLLHLSSLSPCWPFIFSVLQIGLTVLSFCFLGFTGYLWLYHTMLICSGLTTWEHMRRDQITYLKYLPKGYNPFSDGVINNILQFLRQQTRDGGRSPPVNYSSRIPTFNDSKQLSVRCNLVDNQYYSCC